jgi:hypothetical protein
MDPILTPNLITTALTKLVDSAATEAGSKAWDALKALLARHHRAAPPQPATTEEAAAMAEQLVSAAARDDALAEDLLAWQRSASGSDDVTNIVTGQVGRVVQGRDFTNTTITFT